MPPHEKILKRSLFQLIKPISLPEDGLVITKVTKELAHLISNIEETIRLDIDISDQQEKFFIIQCQKKITELWYAYSNMKNQFADPIINDTDIQSCNSDVSIIKRAAKKIWDAHTNQQEKHPIVILIELQVHIQSLENRAHQVISALLELRAFATIKAPMSNNSQTHATLFNSLTMRPLPDMANTLRIQSGTWI